MSNVFNEEYIEKKESVKIGFLCLEKNILSLYKWKEKWYN